MGKKQDDKQTEEQKSSVEKEEFDKLKEDFDNLQNQLKRAVADYQNLEKRIEEGRHEFRNWANTELLKKLLGVLDSLEKVVDLGRPVLSERSESKDWFKGVELSVKQLQQVLRDEGLDEIRADPSTSSGQGVQFNPALHEAVDIRQGEEGKILEVLEKGYNLNGKVLRPARVVVGRQQNKE